LANPQNGRQEPLRDTPEGQLIKANVLKIEKYNPSVHYQQNFAFCYTPIVN